MKHRHTRSGSAKVCAGGEALAALGDSYTTRSIQVFRVRDREIVVFRTYVAPPAETDA